MAHDETSSGAITTIEAYAPLGHYLVLEALGDGGMGTIYAGIDARSAAPVALKVMHPGTHDQRRFEREIAVLARLRHPRIVHYIDHGVSDDGRLYLVMERLVGEDLRAHLERARPSIAECVVLGVHVAEGLQAAHAQNCVHRDIKPSNLFLVGATVEGVKILDFGIARAGGPVASVTRTGVMIGTVGYMAPEQARGDPHLDHRADIFSLGCVLYEALSGEPPFPGEHAVAVLAKILLDEPRPLRSLRAEVPDALEAVVLSMLAKRPEERPRSATETLEALRGCALEASRESASTVGPAAVTYREQRAVCLLLVATNARPIDPLGATEITESQSLTSQAAEAFGATVFPLLDWADIIVFELDVRAIDGIVQAARCALYIRSTRPDTRQALAVGRGERRSGSSVVGRVIDQASLLLNVADPGLIVVDSAAARSLASIFELTARESHACLTGEREEETTRLLLGKPAPFVGRSRELGWLAGLYDQIVEERRTGAVLVTAPPGVGKSRLWREAVRGLMAAGHQPLVLLIRCASTLRESPLAALGAALRREAGVTSDDSTAAAHAKVNARFSTAGRGLTHGGIQWAFLAELCGIRADDAVADSLALARRSPAVMADSQRLAWLDWLQEEAEHRPLLIVVEDLHWCDEMTADFVQAAVRDLEEQSVMLITTAHPEVQERFNLPWPTADTDHLALQPISPRASEMLLRQVLGPLDREVVQAMVARAGGNPFFLEELARALGASTATDLVLPDTVLAVIQAHLHRLGHEERRLLRAASVFDGSFDSRGVARLLGIADEVAAMICHGLADAEMLSIEVSADGTLFRFRHALVRDCAYATLAEEDRPQAHRAVAEWLASAGGHDPALIASHYARGDALPSAGTWFVRAARRACACADPKTALAHASQAITCGVTGESLGEVRVVESDAAMWRGDVIAADLHAREALELTVAGSVAWFTAVRRALICATIAVRMERVEALVKILDPYRGSTASEYALCVAEAAYAYSFAGAVDSAKALLHGVSDLWEAESAPAAVRAALFRARATIIAFEEHPWAALNALRRTIDLFEECGEIRSSCRLRVSYAWVYASIGARKYAEEQLLAGLRLSRRIGDEHSSLYHECILTFTRARGGEVAEARIVWREAIERAEKWGDHRIRGTLHIWLAQVEGELEAIPPEEAVALAREGASVLRPFASPHIWGSSVLALILARRGEVDESLSVARGCVERLRALPSMLDDEFYTWNACTEALERGGAHGEAREAVREALLRVDRLRAAISDPELQALLDAYEPVRRLRARAPVGISGSP